MTWQTVPTDTILYHQVSLATPDGFSEIADQAEDTTVYFAALRVGTCTRNDILHSLGGVVGSGDDVDGGPRCDLQGPIQQCGKAYRCFQLWSEGHLKVRPFIPTHLAYPSCNLKALQCLRYLSRSRQRDEYDDRSCCVGCRHAARPRHSVCDCCGCPRRAEPLLAHGRCCSRSGIAFVTNPIPGAEAVPRSRRSYKTTTMPSSAPKPWTMPSQKTRLRSRHTSLTSCPSLRGRRWQARS